MTDQPKELAVKNTPYNRFKSLIKSDNVQERFRQLLDDRADYFLGSLLSLVSADDKLIECDPSTVFTAAAKAAILRLPIAKELGYAWIVPFKREASFIIGYKGLIQLAIRTSQYEIINAAAIYQGVEVIEDDLTGAVRLEGERTGDEIIGYAAYLKLKNGFQKSIYMTVDKVHQHAKRYSASYGNPKSAWTTNFDEMAKKTVLRLLLSRWGLMSIEMVDADDKMPVVGDDERLTMPTFENLDDNPLEGQFEPEAEPEASENGNGHADEYDWSEWMVENKIADNAHNAKAILEKVKLDGLDDEQVKERLIAYRHWRDMDATPAKAAQLANKGEYPKA